MSIVAWVLTFSPAQIFWSFISGSLIGLGVLIAWQNYANRQSRSPVNDAPRIKARPAISSPYDPVKDEGQGNVDFLSGFDPSVPSVEIDFDGEAIGKRYFMWEMETENGREVNVQRYSIRLVNSSNQDLENLTVKLEKIVEEDSATGSSPLGYELDIQKTIRRRDSAWLPVISYRKEASSWISIEGIDRDKASKEGKMFSPHKRRWLHLAVRADKGVYLPALFQCWVDDQNCLIMKRLNIEAPNL